MDGTLRQILQTVFEYSVTIDKLQTEIEQYKTELARHQMKAAAQEQHVGMPPVTEVVSTDGEAN